MLEHLNIIMCTVRGELRNIAFQSDVQTCMARCECLVSSQLKLEPHRASNFSTILLYNCTKKKQFSVYKAYTEIAL